MAHLAWFKVYAAETLSDERFSGWTIEERGAWFTLLLHAWREGSIPSDQSSLARLCHVDANAMRGLWSAIGDRFVEHPDYPGRLSSPRLEREREAGQEMLAKKSAAGKVGATSRWDKKNKRHSNRMTVASGADANPMRLDGASGQHRAGKPQDSNDTGAPPPGIPTKAGHLAAQAPNGQALLDALAADGWSLTHASAERRAKLEEVLAVDGVQSALLVHIAADLRDRASRGAETVTSIGFYLGEASALAKRKAISIALPEEKPAPLPIVDLAWLGDLPADRREAAKAAWQTKQAEVEATFHPSRAPAVLAIAAQALRAEFLP